MSAQIVFTLAAKNLDRSKQFYEDVFGYAVGQDFPQFVSFEPGDRPTAMALYSGDAPTYDAGIAERAEGYRGVMFSFIVDVNERVDEVISKVDAAGGSVLEAPSQAQWGGYVGYFADPDANLWKVVSPARPAA